MPPEAKQQRRRGAALENAILDAAWEQLVDRGYVGFTFDAVADRACTSRAVLYRRWPTRGDLLRAAIVRHGELRAVVLPDTGSLRGDVLAALRQSNEQRADFLVALSASLGEYYAESGATPGEMRALMLGGQEVMDTLIERAIARGEVDAEHATPVVRAVPFTMYRHHVLMTLAPAPDAWLEEVVDEVFLPLVRPHGAGHAVT